MKTLSADTIAAVDNPHVDAIRLMTVEFDGLTLRLCDRMFGVPGSEFVFDGEIYEPLVISWDTIQTGRIDPSTYEVEPSEMGVTLDNSVPIGGAERFTELFETHDPYFATITVFEIYDHSATAADVVDLFCGTLEDITSLAAEALTLTAVGFEADLSAKFSSTLLTHDDYPGADPDDVGKMIPQGWGPVRKARALAADAGGKTTIVDAMTASSPGNGGTLEVTDGDYMPTGAFILQVDSEQISIAARSGDTLTLAASGARGYGSTDAVEHDAGAACAEIQTEYVYIAADHPVKSIDAVYVEDIRQTSGFTAYTGQSGDEYAGYEGKAVVVFDALPTFVKQVNVVVDDTIDVSDTIGVNQGNHNHAASQEIIVWRFDTAAKTAGTVYNPASICDNDLSTTANFDYLGSQVRLTKAYYESYSGSPAYVRICIATASVGPSVTMQATFAGATVNCATSSYVAKSGWVSLSGYSWASLNAAYAYVNQLNSNNSSYVYEVWAEIAYTPAVSASPATGVAKTGLAAKIGTVTISGNSTAETVIGSSINVSFTGYLDDVSGTYTSAPYAAIERPDHIIKHLLVACCGLSPARIGASYATAGGEYASKNYTLGILLTERPNVRSLINRIAFQAKSLEYWQAGVHHIKYIPVRETAVKVLDQHRIDLRQLTMKTSERAGIENVKTATYNRDWSGASDSVEADQSTVSAQYQISVIKYGALAGNTLSLAYVKAAGQAQDVLNWLLETVGVQRLLPELAGGYFLTDVERGDVLSFAADEFAETDFLARALLGLASDSTLFRVIDKTYRSDGAQQLELVEIVYPVYRANAVGVYDILVKKSLTGSYAIGIGKSVQGKYKILAGASMTGVYAIGIGKALTGLYDIAGTLGDVWGDSDSWGDGDSWGIDF